MTTESGIRCPKCKNNLLIEDQEKALIKKVPNIFYNVFCPRCNKQHLISKNFIF